VFKNIVVLLSLSFLILSSCSVVENYKYQEKLKERVHEYSYVVKPIKSICCPFITFYAKNATQDEDYIYITNYIYQECYVDACNFYEPTDNQTKFNRAIYYLQ